jgi:nicotinate-nucleotide adenylyltransferase
LKPIAILGGTFDPVHNGHLRVAWEAAEALDAEVRLLPAHIPPHRPPPLASPAQRLALLQAALAGQSRLRVDDRELRRSEPSYTIVTLREMRAESGPEQPLILLVGADAFAGLPTWHEWRGLFELAHIGVLNRPGLAAARPADLEAEVGERRIAAADGLGRRANGYVFELPVTPLDISASAVRALLAAGREPRWLVPDGLLADPDLLAVYRGARPSG